MQRPIEQLHAVKIKKLHKAIVSYLYDTKQKNVLWQLDAVVVLLDKKNNKARCKHFEHISLEL